MAGSESAGGQATQAAVAQRATRNARPHARASEQSEPIHVRHERCMGCGGGVGPQIMGSCCWSKPAGGDQALQHRACIMKRSVSFVVARQGKAGCQAHATLHKAYAWRAWQAMHRLCCVCATATMQLSIHARQCVLLRVLMVQTWAAQTCAARQLPALAHNSTLGVQVVHRRALQQQQKRDACMRCALMRFVHGTTCIQLLATF